MIVQHNRKRATDIFKRIIAKFARRRGVKPEGHRRAAVLVKIQLCVFKVFASDHGATFKNVEDVGLVLRRH